MSSTSHPTANRSRSRTATLLVTGLLAAGALTGGAQAASQGPGVTPRSSGVGAQVKALQNQVKTLQKQVSDLQELLDCQYVMPVGRYGDSGSSGSFGYKWYDEAGNGYLTTALDYVETSDFDPHYDDWFVAADSSCVDVSSRASLSGASFRIAPAPHGRAATAFRRYPVPPTTAG